MKEFIKKTISIIAIVGVLASLCACSKKNDSDGVKQETTTSKQEINEDYMYKYLKSLPSNSDRNDFVNFWHYTVTYCGCIKTELKNINNDKTFEFDPTDENSIPEEIKDIYSFSDINIENTQGKHKDFKLVIDGTDVKFSFDGVQFYPTTYGYTEVQNLIDSLKSE